MPRAGRAKFKAGRVAHFPRSADRRLLFPHDDGVAVHKAQRGDLPAEDERVKVGLGNVFAAAFDAYAAVAALARIYAACLIEECQDVVRRRPCITARTADESRDEHGDGLGVQGTDIHLRTLHACDIEPAGYGLPDLFSVAPGQSGNGGLAGTRNIQRAFRRNGEHVFLREPAAPDAHQDAVAGLERRTGTGGKVALEEIAAKRRKVRRFRPGHAGSRAGKHDADDKLG